MHKLARRFIAVASGSAVAMMFAVGSASAAPAPSGVTVITGSASAVTTTTAMLNGVINTHGVKTEWQFQYGRSTTYSTATPVKTIAAGGGTVHVSAEVKDLKAATTYHFRLVAITSSAAGVVRTKGADAMFTTRGSGFLVLEHTRLPVRNGLVSVTLRCDSTIACTGNLSVHTRSKLRTTGTFASVVCAARPFSIPAGARVTLVAKGRRACMSLLRKNPHHSLIGKLIVRPKSGQPALIRTVILALR